MKFIKLCLSLFIIAFVSKAQNPSRQITYKIIEKDSVLLPLNEDYYLIEDSCAQIIRHCRLNFQTKSFYGKFTDVSSTNPNITVSEGTYSLSGLKDGQFSCYYLNGKLKAKGSFKDNKYDGKWEFYYDNGTPELTFEVINGVYTIYDLWKADGSKYVDKGNGNYTSFFGGLCWKGKLINGKPDGKWVLVNTDDVSNTPLATERFKKGEFNSGEMRDINYNTSRLTLVSPYKLPMVNAEKMLISSVPCNGTKRRHIVNAQYEDGLKLFTGYISDAVLPYMSRLNFQGLHTTIDLTGEVAENGAIINLKNNGSANESIARGLILQLKQLPPLHPATVDGMPVKQKLVITLVITNGWYRFSYRFLPIQIN